jgi:hypothetical protein
LGKEFLYLFELSLGIVLAIYNKEVLLGFLPHKGFLEIIIFDLVSHTSLNKNFRHGFEFYTNVLGKKLSYLTLH